jgi:hypothetical protein
MNISLPKTISGWCMWLFFLVVGLGLFLTLPAFIAPALALAYAILSVLGM